MRPRPRPRPLSRLLLLLLMSAPACSDDASDDAANTQDTTPQDDTSFPDLTPDTTSPDTTTDTTTQDTSPDDVAADTAADAADAIDDAADATQPPVDAVCATSLTVGETFTLDPTGPSTQIDPAVAHDGQAFWVVYSEPDPSSSEFDVHALRLNCNGTHARPPFRAQATAGGNDLGPTVAVSGDQVMIAWTDSSGVGESNLDLYQRRFTIAGDPLDAAQVNLEPLLNGDAQPVGAWMPALSATRDGFALAGVWASPQAERFQVFVQRLDLEGAPVGDAVDLLSEPLITQQQPAISAADDDTLFVSWSRSTDDETLGRVIHTRWDAGAAAPETPSLALGPVEGMGSSLDAADSRAYLAFEALSGGDHDIGLKRAADLDPTAAALPLGAEGRIDIAPAVAVGPGGAAVMWLRRTSGIQHEVVVQRVIDSGAALDARPEQVIATEQPAAPYAPAITHVIDHVYLLVWSEGTNPDFRVKARFVDLR